MTVDDFGLGAVFFCLFSKPMMTHFLSDFFYLKRGRDFPVSLKQPIEWRTFANLFLYAYFDGVNSLSPKRRVDFCPKN